VEEVASPLTRRARQRGGRQLRNPPPVPMKRRRSGGDWSDRRSVPDRARPKMALCPSARARDLRGTTRAVGSTVSGATWHLA